MSKLDQIKNMDTMNDPLAINQLDVQLLKTRMENLRDKMQEDLEKSAEVLKVMRDLQQGVNNAAAALREANKNVKDFPDDMAKRLEASAKKCEESAQRAQAIYETARAVVTGTGRTGILHIAAAALLSSLISTAAVMFIR